MYGSQPGMPKPIYNPPVPSDQMIGQVKLGQIIVVQGYMPPNISKPSVINLKPAMGSDDNIHFHMSIRFDQKCIVRNTKQGGGYGAEERGGGMPLSKGQQFQLIIAVQQNAFKVSVNGRHFCDYNHRAAFQQINVIGFTGEFQVQNISFQHDYSVAPVHPNYPMGQAAPPLPGFIPPSQPAPPAYSPYPSIPPIFNPPVPYNGFIPGGLYPGRMILVQGKVNPSPTRFHINLLLGGDSALHFNPRFKENVVVRNTKQGGKYGTTERSGPGCPFSPGAIFEVKIMVEANCYKIMTNNQHYCDYNHRMWELHMIQGLEIGGDVTLTQIIIQ